MSAAAIDISTRDHPISHEIETERLYLRPIGRSDVEGYHQLLSDPQVMKFIGLAAGHTFSLDEVHSLIDGAMRIWNERGYGRWSVFERETDEFVGFCGFRCEDGVPELITTIHERFWGTGYAVEGCDASLDYGFDNLGFTEVCSYTRSENTRARHMLNKIGAEFLGIVDFYGVEAAAFRITR